MPTKSTQSGGMPGGRGRQSSPSAWLRETIDAISDREATARVWFTRGEPRRVDTVPCAVPYLPSGSLMKPHQGRPLVGSMPWWVTV